MRVKLKDAFNLQMGKTPSRSDLSLWGGNNKWISIADIGSAKKQISSTKECITDEGVSRSGIKVVPEGTVIMSFKLSIGKTAIVSEDMYTNEAIMAFIDNGTYCIDPNYLYHLCCGTDWTQGGNKAVMGLTLNKATLSEMEIELPTLEEQREIASILDQLDAIIEKRHDELNMIEQLVKSRFIELFECKPWETTRAGTIMFNMRNGVSPSNVGTHPAKVLTLSAITQGDFDPDAWKDGMFDTVPPIEKRVMASDFYMCRGNGNKNLVGAGVYSKEDRYDLVFPDTAIAATVDLQRACLPYLFHAWKRPSVREQIEMGARTTNGTYKINQGVVSNVELILPPLELQKQFAAFVEQTDKSKLAVQKSLEELEILKKSLMQQYFG